MFIFNQANTGKLVFYLAKARKPIVFKTGKNVLRKKVGF